MSENIQSKLAEKKLTSLREKTGEDSGGELRGKVAELVRNALFLQNQEKRKEKWLAVVSEADGAFLQQISAAVIRENLRYKKGERDINSILDARSAQQKLRRQKEGKQLGKLKANLPLGNDLFKIRFPLDLMAESISGFQGTSLQQASPQKADLIFLSFARIILKEFFFRQEEYLKNHDRFLEELQNGYPTVALTPEESVVIDLLREAREAEALTSLEKEVQTSWIIAVAALDAVVFPELKDSRQNAPA